MKVSNQIYKTFSLLIILREQPQLALTDQFPKHKINLSGKDYEESEHGEFNGHYDWLMNPNGQIIGVRYFVFDYMKYLCSKVEKLSYCIVQDNIIQIYFSDDRCVDEDNSDHQDFSGDRLFTSNNDEMIMSFYLEGLSKADLCESIKFKHSILGCNEILFELKE